MILAHMGPSDASQRDLSGGTQVSRDHPKPWSAPSCEVLRSPWRHGECDPRCDPPARPLQPAPHVSPCIPVPRGCTGTALTRLVQVAGVERAARVPAADFSRPVRPGYGRCAPPPQPPPHCACLPAALSGCVGCRRRLLGCLQHQI